MSDLPDRFIPNEEQVVEASCTACRRPIGTLQYNSMQKDGDWFHRDCLFERSTRFEKADTPRRCGSCGAWSSWTHREQTQAGRVCSCCGRSHRGATPREFDGPAPAEGGESR